jgi:multidrug resistance efflux pump
MRIHFRRAPERSPDEIGGIKIPYVKGKRSVHRWLWYLILLVVVSPILYLSIGVLDSWLGLRADGSVLLDQQEVRAAEAGAVAELKANVGDLVSAGEALVVLDGAELDAAAARNSAQLQSLTASHPTAEARRLGLAQELRLREQALQYQQERRAVIEGLVRAGAATAAELQQADAAATEAEATLIHARQGSAADSASLDMARAERRVIEARRGAMTHRAPFAGRILEVLVKPGEYVSAGEPLIVMARFDNPRVVAYAPPKFATQLRIGALATIRFPDGTQTVASISEAPKVTQRMPADLVDQFGLRPMTVVLHLLPQEKWPDNQRIQGLPVAVRFHYRWESSRN